MTPDVQKADFGKGVWYRAVVGPPGSREAATSVCRDLQIAGYAGLCGPMNLLRDKRNADTDEDAEGGGKHVHRIGDHASSALSDGCGAGDSRPPVVGRRV
jgi:hypothetical protein